MTYFYLIKEHNEELKFKIEMECPTPVYESDPNCKQVIRYCAEDFFGEHDNAAKNIKIAGEFLLSTRSGAGKVTPTRHERDLINST